MCDPVPTAAACRSRPAQRANVLPTASSRKASPASAQSRLTYARARKSFSENTTRVTAGAAASENPASVSSSPISRSISIFTSPQSRVPSTQLAIPILVDEVLRRRLSQRAKPLRAVRSHPDEIPRCYRIPLVTEPINPAALQHHESVFHHVDLDHRQRRAR